MVTGQYAQPTRIMHGWSHLLMAQLSLAIRQWKPCGSCWMPASTAFDCLVRPKRIGQRRAALSPRPWAAGDRAAGGMMPGANADSCDHGAYLA